MPDTTTCTFSGGDLDGETKEIESAHIELNQGEEWVFWLQTYDTGKKRQGGDFDGEPIFHFAHSYYKRQAGSDAPFTLEDQTEGENTFAGDFNNV